jgi:transcriptional regulator with XRE-family HTH domain
MPPTSAPGPGPLPVLPPAGGGRQGVGPLLREWRRRRRRTQLELSLAAGVSTRHLSYVENGRARPSREVVLALASSLDVPPREQGRLLLAAGYSPTAGATGPTATPAPAEMAAVRATCQRLLDAAEPYPAVVLDGRWDVVAGNPASGLFLEGVPAHLTRPAVNLFRLTLHPEGLAARTGNFEQWGRHALAQLRRLVDSTADPRLEAILAEVSAYPNVVELLRDGVSDDDIALVLPLRYHLGSHELTFITTLTVFATPADATIGELAIEVCFPGDDTTDAYLRARSPG